MSKIEIKMSEMFMKDMIKGLLSLDSGSTWQCDTVRHQVKLLFNGNVYRVQKDIYNWLSVKERKHNFELLGGN
jgi:hypothetical protein